MVFLRNSDLFLGNRIGKCVLDFWIIWLNGILGVSTFSTKCIFFFKKFFEYDNQALRLITEFTGCFSLYGLFFQITVVYFSHLTHCSPPNLHFLLTDQGWRCYQGRKEEMSVL